MTDSADASVWPTFHGRIDAQATVRLRVGGNCAAGSIATAPPGYKSLFGNMEVGADSKAGC